MCMDCYSMEGAQRFAKDAWRSSCKKISFGSNKTNRLSALGEEKNLSPNLLGGEAGLLGGKLPPTSPTG